MFRHLILIFCGLLTYTVSFGQEQFIVKKDLGDQWHYFRNDSYAPIPESELKNLKSIHFNVDASQYPEQHLLIKSARPFFVFVNGKLCQKFVGHLTLSLDSVSAANGTSSLTLTLFQEKINPQDLQTMIISYRDHDQQPNDFHKPRSYFKDFTIVAGLILIVFFVVLLKLHPKLAADYFSITRILSLREVEDNQPNARFVISANVVFYAFSSLLLGLCLIVLLHHLPEGYLLPLTFKAMTFGGVLLQWIRLSAIILLLLFGKILLIFSLSNLFGMRGIAGIHFFNWIRLTLIISGSFSMILFVYYISRGYDTQVYVIMLSVIIAALVGWIVIVFLKLNNRTEHSMFHLFSYICATEVIPLLITIKVLFH
jgi:hypothetical protein